MERGYLFYYGSGRSDLTLPHQQAVARFFIERAPETLELPDPDMDVTTSPVVFRREKILHPEGVVKSGISHLTFNAPTLHFTDMSLGTVGSVSFDAGAPAQVKPMLTLAHPAHIDAFGPSRGVGDAASANFQWVVADLGSFGPQDHQLGKLYSFDEGTGDTHILLEQCGRVAGTEAKDLDGDGQVDIAVAEFGWRSTGSLRLLWGGNDSRWTEQVLSEQHGFSHLLAVDIDRDDDLDLVALQSQEYETVWCFRNEGERRFTSEKLFAAAVPDYGFSCIVAADLDADGDLDLALSNGDSMDSRLLKPHHGIGWLENQGELQFVHHRIGQQPGAYGVDVGDLDGDGDLDVVACTMTWWDDLPFNTLVWFEQQSPGNFTRHSLDLSTDQHACLKIGDFDADGDADIAVGEFDQSGSSATWLSVWWNEGVK